MTALVVTKKPCDTICDGTQMFTEHEYWESYICDKIKFVKNKNCDEAQIVNEKKFWIRAKVTKTQLVKINK